MSPISVNGDLSTTRLPAVSNSEREARARVALSAIACELFGVPADADPRNPGPELLAARQWRDEMYAALGLTQQALAATPTAPAANPTGKPRVVATIRRQAAEDDFRPRGACRDQDPELFFPVGTDGPALAQAEQAKAVCRRCPVINECLSWALDHQEYGVAGGLSEVERRAYKSRLTHTVRAAA